jgi:hypothetical protein
MFLTDRCPDVGHCVPVAVGAALLFSVLAGLAVYLFVVSLGFSRFWEACLWGLLTVVSASMAPYRTENSYYLVFLLLLASAVIGKNRLAALGLAAVCSAICMLIKVSLGIGASFPLFVAVLFCAENKKDALRSFLIVAAVYATVLTFVWAAVGQPVLNLIPYILNSHAIISGYQHSLAQSLTRSSYMVGLYIMCVLLLVVWVKEIGTPASRRLILVLSFPVFTAYKHSIVRMGAVHIHHFPLVMQLVVWVFFAYSASLHKAKASAAFAVLILTMSGIAPLLTGRGHEIRELDLDQRFLRAVCSIPRGLSELKSLASLQDRRLRMGEIQDAEFQKHKIPAEWLREIGSAGVDVWSYNLMPVFANGLAYRPRPTVTTIIAASAAADDWDCAFLRSGRGTPYLFLGQTDIVTGGVHFLWAEPKAFLAIMDLYDVIQDDGSMALLKRRTSGGRLSSAQFIGETAVSSDGLVPVPVAGPGELVFAEFIIPQSIVDNVKSFVYKPSNVRVEVDYGDEKISYKILPTNTAHALLINPLPKGVAQMGKFFKDLTGSEVLFARFNEGTRRKALTGFSIRWYKRFVEKTA